MYFLNMPCYDGDDDDDGWDGGDGNTRRRNLNWEIPAASLVIPRSEKSECDPVSIFLVEWLNIFFNFFNCLENVENG